MVRLRQRIAAVVHPDLEDDERRRVRHRGSDEHVIDSMVHHVGALLVRVKRDRGRLHEGDVDVLRLSDAIDLVGVEVALVEARDDAHGVVAREHRVQVTVLRERQPIGQVIQAVLVHDLRGLAEIVQWHAVDLAGRSGSAGEGHPAREREVKVLALRIELDAVHAQAPASEEAEQRVHDDRHGLTTTRGNHEDDALDAVRHVELARRADDDPVRDGRRQAGNGRHLDELREGRRRVQRLGPGGPEARVDDRELHHTELGAVHVQVAIRVERGLAEGVLEQDVLAVGLERVDEVTVVEIVDPNPGGR